jgi:hypothetical protein
MTKDHKKRSGLGEPSEATPLAPSSDRSLWAGWPAPQHLSGDWRRVGGESTTGASACQRGINLAAAPGAQPGTAQLAGSAHPTAV